MTVDRSTLQRAAEVADGIAHDESLPDEVRDKAYDVYWEMSEVLCYVGKPADGEIRMVPASFGVPEYYSKLIVELELELGPEAVMDNVGRFALARHCAKLVDNALYTIDFVLSASRSCARSSPVSDAPLPTRRN